MDVYRKPALTCEAQADLLIKRGLIVNSRELLVHTLQSISYYRLSAYLYPFKKDSCDDYKPGTTFEAIYQRYTFDRRLRLLVFDALERIETATKARIVNVFSLEHGGFGYTDISNFNGFPPERFNIFLNEISSITNKKEKEQFVSHYRSSYSDSDLPLWMVSELISFGTMVTMFNFMNFHEQKKVALFFKLPVKVFKQWLLALLHVRNICAHHSRLWNTVLGISPCIPQGKAFTGWKDLNNRRIFFLLLTLRYLLRYCAPRTHWKSRIEKLFEEYPTLPLVSLGFPNNWREHSLWATHERN